MRHPIRPFVSAVFLCVGILGLAACSSGEPPSPAETGSPLERYFSLFGGTGESAQRAQEAAVQDAVAACMKEAGFEYTPAADSVTMVSSDSLDVEWGSPEFAERYGYGISTDPFGMDGGEADAPVDPNADYVDSLSESERAAYEEALYGAVTADPEEYDWSTSGCYGTAQHDALADIAFWNDPVYIGLSNEMNAIPSKAQEADEVAAGAGKWADCMAQAGHPGLASPEDAQSSINEEFSALQGAGAGRPDDAPTTETDADSGGRTFVTGGDVDPEKLEALQQKEIELAVADSTCGESTGYTAAVERETNRLEQEFVDRNRSALDGLVAKYGAK